MFETIEVVLPRKAGVDAEHDLAAAKRFLLALSFMSVPLRRRIHSGTPRFLLEITCDAGEVRFFLGTQKAYLPFLEKQVHAHYPDAKVRHVFNKASLLHRGATRTGYLRFGKTAHNMRLVDSLEQLLRSFRHMRTHEAVSVRYIVQSASRGKFLVTARILVSARSPEDADRILGQLARSFDRYSVLRDGSAAPHAFVLDASQLAMLYRILRTSFAPSARRIPQGVASQGTLLGHAEYAGASVPLYISDADRRRHVYCVGHAGTGRRILLFHMIMQDILAGRRVCVVDLEGELADEVRHHVARDHNLDARNVMLCTSRGEAEAMLSRMDSIKDYCVYFDEFQGLVPDIGEHFLSRASDLGIRLVLTHRSVTGISERKFAEMLDSIGTIISYGLQESDEAFVHTYARLGDAADDLRYLSKFDAAIRLPVGGALQEVCTMATNKTGVL